jgi:hypothetical protein
MPRGHAFTHGLFSSRHPKLRCPSPASACIPSLAGGQYRTHRRMRHPKVERLCVLLNRRSCQSGDVH